MMENIAIAHLDDCGDAKQQANGKPMSPVIIFN
jgi:hypothetical protein